MKNRTTPIILASIMMFILACAQGTQIVPVPTSTQSRLTTSAPEKVVISNTPVSSPTITNSPVPTNTPVPTKTPTLVPTSTPVPKPITISGKNNGVVDLKKWDGPAIIKAIAKGTSNFFVYSIGPNNEKQNLLFNAIGNYEGTVPLDFEDGKSTSRLQIQAEGTWNFTIMPITMIRREKIPGKFSGLNDDVIYLDGGKPDLLHYEAKGSSNFIVYAYGSTRSLVVNVIAPTSGTSVLKTDVNILVVKGEKDWTFEVTTK